MIDQYYGMQELYEVVLKAKAPMQLGSKKIEQQQPVLYFQDIKLSVISEHNNPIMARGGWGNLPHVVWEDRSEVSFALSQGVVSDIGLGLVLGANITHKQQHQQLLARRREGPFTLDVNGCIELKNWPVMLPKKKTFIYEYARGVIQKKVYGERIMGHKDPFDDTKTDLPYIKIYEDKGLTIPCIKDDNKQYVIEYYYEYPTSALIYSIQKERFNGFFSLEGKFYSKDENEGINYTNLLYMPKVRIVSDINLRLGERADPSMSVFNIIGMPDSTSYNSKGLILEITRLDNDIDEQCI